MPSDQAYRTHFGSWGNALKEAGLEVKKPTISPQCRAATIAAHTGKRSYSWKGGRTLNNGYVLLWTGNGYRGEHCLVMEKVLGRPLRNRENVHHKNGKRDDNRPENLELWVSVQPSGQRVEDLVKFAKEILDAYPEV